MTGRSRKNLIPAVIGLESRNLLTVISPIAFGRSAPTAQHGHSSAISKPAPSANGIGNPSPSGYLDPATLTPRGLAMSRFSAGSSGPFAVTSPVFVGQLADFTFIGRSSSNRFLHGTTLMHIETPATPDGQTSGYVALPDRNVAATGSILTLDLGASAANSAGPGQQVPTIYDAKGRPIQLGFNVDTNRSGGTFAGAEGQGTVSITYRPGHSKNSAGNATLIFRGFVLVSGVNDITAYNIPRFG